MIKEFEELLHILGKEFNAQLILGNTDKVKEINQQMLDIQIKIIKLKHKELQK